MYLSQSDQRDIEIDLEIDDLIRVGQAHSDRSFARPLPTNRRYGNFAEFCTNLPL